MNLINLILFLIIWLLCYISMPILIPLFILNPTSFYLLALWFFIILFLIMLLSFATHKTCPFCKEKVRRWSLKCKHCWEFFEKKNNVQN